MRHFILVSDYFFSKYEIGNDGGGGRVEIGPISRKKILLRKLAEALLSTKNGLSL